MRWTLDVEHGRMLLFSVGVHLCRFINSVEHARVRYTTRYSTPRLSVFTVCCRIMCLSTHLPLVCFHLGAHNGDVGGPDCSCLIPCVPCVDHICMVTENVYRSKAAHVRAAVCRAQSGRSRTHNPSTVCRDSDTSMSGKTGGLVRVF